ncbi:hypothetical protein RB195_005832 [Necator americanus]
MKMSSDIEKFHGPTFSSLVDVSLRKERSLVQKVSCCSAVELGAVVVGSAVYEVFMELPECELLNEAMVSLKRKQDNLPPKRALLWMNEHMSMEQKEKCRLMEYHDMRLFLARCPINILSNTIFKPFLPIVKNFLLKKLFLFTNKSPLYRILPEFPSERHLPGIVNALGPMEQLAEKYPHLARMKHEMIFNIMDFAIRYCLDWICELLLLECDNKGKVKYYCPRVGQGKRKNSTGKKSKRANRSQESSSRKSDVLQPKTDNDDSGWETQMMTNSSSTNVSNLDYLKEEPVAKRAKVKVIKLKEEEEETHKPSIAPSSSGTVVQHPQKPDSPQFTSQKVSHTSPNLNLTQSLSVPSFSMIHDNWSDMLTMALTDPSLPMHYKTMIHCLVASNRDMKNMIVMMRTRPP